MNIGPVTAIPAAVYRSIDWTVPKQAVKDLLVAVFGRERLAACTMTGKRSNANPVCQPVRPALDGVQLEEMFGKSFRFH